MMLVPIAQNEYFTSQSHISKPLVRVVVSLILKKKDVQQPRKIRRTAGTTNFDRCDREFTVQTKPAIRKKQPIHELSHIIVAFTAFLHEHMQD